ncbi:hypothetical protein PG988_008040 [Apiospora saccharicola]
MRHNGYQQWKATALTVLMSADSGGMDAADAKARKGRLDMLTASVLAYRESSKYPEFVLALNINHSRNRGCLISAVRVNAIFNFNVRNNITGTVDQTFLLSVMECYIAIISISLPMLRPFYRRWRARHSSKLSDTPGNDGIVTFGQGDPDKKAGLTRMPSIPHTSQWELEEYEDAAGHDASSERRPRPVNRISGS